MRILCLSPFTTAPTFVNRTLPLLSRLVQRGHKVDIFLPHFAKQLSLTSEAYDKLHSPSEERVDEKARPNPLRKLFRRLASPEVGKLMFPLSGTDELLIVLECLIHYFSKKNDYNLIYVSKPWLRTSGPGLLLGRKWKTPVVLDMDDYEIHQDSYLLNRFQGIVVSSRELMSLLKRYAPLYIPNSTDLETFNPERFPGHGPEKCSLIWSGIMYEYLRLENLVIAISHMNEDATLNFSGYGPKMGELIHTAKSLNLEHKVRIYKWERRVAVPRRLADADIGVIYTADTLYERCKCPGKLFEYMAMQLPVVATDVGEAAATIREADCGIEVPPNDPKAFASAFDYLVQNPDVRRKMGENGRRFLLARQNHEVLASNLEEYLNRMSHRLDVN